MEGHNVAELYCMPRGTMSCSTRRVFFTTCLVLLLVNSSSSLDKNVSKPGSRIYVTNESSGDMSVIDASTLEVLATVPLGKRPRGLHSSPDGKTIYVALSGSPIGGPGVDESKLPPPDKTADGIGVFDVRQNKLIRLIQSGSDPENFDLSRDGRHIFVSNEDDSKASMIDVASGKVTKTFAVGEEPEGVKIAPNGKFVYVTSENTGTISVIDIAAEKIIKTFKVGKASTLGGVSAQQLPGVCERRKRWRGDGSRLHKARSRTNHFPG